MQTLNRTLLIAVLALGFTLIGFVARGVAAPQAPAGTPQSLGLPYAGTIRTSGGPVTATCNFTFSLWDANVGGDEIATLNQSLAVVNGRYSTNLDFGLGAFNGEQRWLQVAVQCPGDLSATTLTPRQTFGVVPYALFAFDTAGYQNVIVVAKSGGDFDTITAALDSLPAVPDPTLIYIAPGSYVEQITLKPNVHLQGAGPTLTAITGLGSNTLDASAATVVINSGTSDATNTLRDLRIFASNNTDYAMGVYSNANGFVLDNVEILLNSAAINISGYGIYLTGNDPNFSYVIRNSQIRLVGNGVPNRYGIYQVSNIPIEIVNTTIDISGSSTLSHGLYINTNYPLTLRDVHINSANYDIGGETVNVYLENVRGQIDGLTIESYPQGGGPATGLKILQTASVPLTIRNLNIYQIGQLGGVSNIGIDLDGVTSNTHFENANVQIWDGSTAIGIRSKDSGARFNTTSTSVIGVNGVGLQIVANSGPFIQLNYLGGYLSAGLHAVDQQAGSNVRLVLANVGLFGPGPNFDATLGAQICAGVYSAIGDFYPDTCP